MYKKKHALFFRVKNSSREQQRHGIFQWRENRDSLRKKTSRHLQVMTKKIQKIKVPTNLSLLMNYTERNGLHGNWLNICKYKRLLENQYTTV